ARAASPALGPVSRRPGRPDGMPKEPTISVADSPAEPPDRPSRPLPERLAAVRAPRGRVSRPVLAGVLVAVLAAGLLAAHELTAAGRIRGGGRVGGGDLSRLTPA